MLPDSLLYNHAIRQTRRRLAGCFGSVYTGVRAARFSILIDFRPFVMGELLKIGKFDSLGSGVSFGAGLSLVTQFAIHFLGLA